jgi:WXG100 family type VII secretion target
MGVISVTPEQLRQEAQVYLRAKEGIEHQIQQVKSMNHQIEQQWKGQAFQAYLEQYNQLEAQVKKFEELLVSINHQLNQYANTVAERDQQDARGFGFN